MRGATGRTGKYGKKVRGLVLTGQKAGFRKAIGGQVSIERAVKAILMGSGVTPILNHFYMQFGKKIYKLTRKYTGGILETEACIEFRKWSSRGLNESVLDEILKLYMPGFTCIIVACDYPLESDVKAGVTYDFGAKVGTYVCPPCDYPAVTDVDKGVSYAYGAMIGTLDRGLPWTGQTTSYAAGDDGAYQKGHTTDRPIVKGAGSTRFVDNGDGTVTDKATGLMWIKDPKTNPGAPFNATMTWALAVSRCEALVFAGYDDWRLPNIKEYASIFDYEVGNPTVDTYFFPTIPSENCWSSTAGATDPANAANYARFIAGWIGTALKTGSFYVKPVRGGKP